MKSKTAWTTFWKHGLGEGGCLPDAPAVRARLDGFWNDFAKSFDGPSKVVDLACGAGAVAYRLVDANPALHVTGIDYAEVGTSRREQVELCSGVSIEAQPFADASLDGAVSQFGVEYGDPKAVGAELVRTLKPGAPFAFILHHAQSLIVRNNRERASALGAVSSPTVERSFMTSDRMGLAGALLAIRKGNPRKDVIDQIARGLAMELSSETTERREQWDHFAVMVESEMVILGALDAAAVDDIARWTALLTSDLEVVEADLITDALDTPVAWKVRGHRVY